jgi:hypothetical protein
MRKGTAHASDEMRSEYDLSRLKGGVRGKYYEWAKAAQSLVLIEPDLAKVFPNQASVNRALRLLLSAAKAGQTRRPLRRPAVASSRRVAQKAAGRC